MQQSSEELYLELLKKTLSFSLWPKPPVPVNPRFYRKPIKKLVFKFLMHYLHKRNMFVAKFWRRSNKAGTSGQSGTGYAD